MKRQTTFSLSVGIAILAAGIIGMVVLFQFRKPPAEASTAPEQRKLDVEVERATPIRHTVMIEGFGAARPSIAVAISPEVSGRVVFASDRLRVGERVDAGELLLTLDANQYASVISEREAQVAQIRAEIERLKAEHTSDASRLAMLERSRELARAQFERARMLLGEGVGNQLEVDRSEQEYNDAADRFRQLQCTVDAYPMTHEEAQSRLMAAQAALERARLDFAKTEIFAPFSGRIDSVSVSTTGEPTQSGSTAIAAGHFAEAGRPLFVLEDDSAMEVPIKLNAHDAHGWLQRASGNHAAVTPVDCVVTWTEIVNGPSWTGTLERIENYDAASRTMTAVVTVDLEEQAPGAFPLEEGMFCSVQLPGNTLEHVFVIPQSGISVDGTVHLAVDGKLESRRVSVARTEGSLAYIDDGISAGELIITTRLINPIEGSLLRVASDLVASAD